MAFVKTKQQSQTQNRVGSSYGERRELSQMPKSQAARRPVHQQPVDNFNRIPKGNPARFAPKAQYRTSNGAAQDRETPYKTAIHNHLEKGSAPVMAHGFKAMPSNRALLNFLDRVIATPKKKAASNVSIKQKPLNKVKTRAQRSSSQVRPSLPKTGRPIPTLGNTGTKKA